MVTVHTMEDPVKRFLALLLVLSPLTPVYAQQSEIDLSSRRQPVRVSVSMLYQGYSDDTLRVSELSTPLTASLPLGRNLSLNMWTSHATVTGRDLERIGGISDAQVTLNYYQVVGRGSLVFSLGVNLPTGRKELTQKEFNTSKQSSLNFFDFRVPNLGQGFNLSPGLVWAVPLSETFVLGLGASYQYKGGFKPISGMTEDYEPGDEVLVTIGADYRLNRTSSLSTDFTYTIYATDKIGGLEVFESGNKVTMAIQILKHFGYNELRLLAFYRSRAKSDFLGPALNTNQILPNHAEWVGTYRLRLRRTTYVRFLAQGRLFGEASIYPSKRLLDVGVLPEVALMDDVSVLGQFIYTLGSFSGLEAGIGVAARL